MGVNLLHRSTCLSTQSNMAPKIHQLWWFPYLSKIAEMKVKLERSISMITTSLLHSDRLFKLILNRFFDSSKGSNFVALAHNTMDRGPTKPPNYRVPEEVDSAKICSQNSSARVEPSKRSTFEATSMDTQERYVPKNCENVDNANDFFESYEQKKKDYFELQLKGLSDLLNDLQQASTTFVPYLEDFSVNT